MLQLKPFVRVLHIALAARSKVTDKGAIYFKQIEPAVKWFKHFFEDI